MVNFGTTLIVCAAVASLAMLLASVVYADGVLAELLQELRDETDHEKKIDDVKKLLQSRAAGDSPIDKSENLQRGLTDAQKERALYLHNLYRGKEGASDMNKLVWSDQLAQMAQEWSERCSFKHRSLYSPDGEGYVKPESVGFPGEFLGENLWVGSANQFVVPDAGIDGWYDEKKDYTYSSMQCSGVCGHYVAMAWGPSVAVGCGFAQCDNLQVGGQTWQGGVMLTCNYAPGVVSNQHPFKFGPPCTECSSGRMFCTDNLCDNSCTAVGSAGNCECNTDCGHGTLESSSCSCRCDDGYTGLHCNEVCEDKDNRCGDNGWPELFCNKEEMLAKDQLYFHYQVVAACPKLCGKCVAAKRREVYRHLSSSNHHQQPQLVSDLNYRRRV